MSDKPYRLTRKYYNNNVIKTYEHNYATLDKAYKAIIELIDESDHYTFNLHKIIATKPDGSKVAVELRNVAKPCIIPMCELVGSYQTDRKFRPENST